MPTQMSCNTKPRCHSRQVRPTATLRLVSSRRNSTLVLPYFPHGCDRCPSDPYCSQICPPDPQMPRSGFISGVAGLKSQISDLGAGARRVRPGSRSSPVRSTLPARLHPCRHPPSPHHPHPHTLPAPAMGYPSHMPLDAQKSLHQPFPGVMNRGKGRESISTSKGRGGRVV